MHTEVNFIPIYISLFSTQLFYAKESRIKIESSSIFLNLLFSEIQDMKGRIFHRRILFVSKHIFK